MSSPTPAKPATEKDKTEVVYVGDAGTREITKAQWKGAGVENQDKTVWNDENGYSLPIDQFTDKALEVLKRDRNIKVR